MKRYEVIWHPFAEERLADIWVNANDRTAVTAAAAALDSALEHRALRFGESRTSSVHRYAFALPLGIEFDVIEDDLKVIVTAVWSMGRE